MSDRADQHRTSHRILARQLLPVVLVSVWPFVGFADQNKKELLDYGQLLIAACICIAIIVCAFLALRWIVRPHYRTRLAAIFAMGVLAFFNYHIVDVWAMDQGFSRARYSLAIWAAIFIGTGLVAWLTCKRPASLNVVSAIIAAMVAVPLGSVLWHAARADAIETPGKTKLVAGEPRAGVKRRPNVYFLLIDAYSRADRLKAMFGIDNSPFLRALARRGFVVAGRARANYPVTSISISSTLDMTYLLESSTPNAASQQLYSVKIAGFNKTVDRFKAMGFRYIHAGAGNWTGSICRGAEDLCVRPPSRPRWSSFGQQEMALLAMTPLEIVARAARLELIAQKNLTHQRFRAAIRRFGRSPFFVFFHSMDVHGAPFDAQCRHVGGMGRMRAAMPEVVRGHHAHTIRCANREILKTIDAILAGDRTAIIVLQSDHGVGSPGWNKRIHGKITRADFLNRFGILSALRLPRACRDQIERGKTAINTFPIVFGCLDGRAPKLLPNRSYLMNYAVDKVRVWRDD